MASNSKSVEKLLIQIRADLKDLKNLQAELKNVRKEGTDAAASIGEGFKNALGSIAAGFTTLRIKGIFDNAVADANRLEKTMLGLQATAKLTGNSFSQIKNAVTNLSKDGVLSIDQASQSMKVLLAQGVAADKAFQLVDAAKKVGAFNNIVGDTGQAVQDFIKFLQTGSAELAENLDPSLVKVVKSLGGYEAVANNAAAKQKLINAVIEKGTKLTGDYEKFLQSGSQAQVTFGKAQEKISQNFGEKLAPAYAKVYSLGAQLLNGIGDLIKNFSSFTVSVVSFSALGVAAFVTLGGAAVTFGFVTKAAFLSILGPVGLIVAGVAALAVALKALGPPDPEEVVKGYEEISSAIDEVTAKAKEIEKQNVRTIEQNGELAKSQIELRKRAQELGVDYDSLAAKTKNLAEQSQILKSIAREQAAAILRERLQSLEARAPYARRFSTAERVLSAGLSPALAGAADIYDKDKIDADRKATLEAYAKLYQQDTVAQQQAAAATGGKGVEARFLETRRKLEEIAQNERYTIAAANAAKIDSGERTRRIENAKRDAKINAEQEISALTTAYAEYRDDKYTADRIALERSTNEAKKASEQLLESQLLKVEATRVRDLALFKGNAAAIEAVNELSEDKIYRLKKENLERLAKINEANTQKQIKLIADSFGATSTAASQIAKGITEVRSGNISGAANALSGAGGLGKGLEGLGVISAGGTASKIFSGAGIAGQAFGSIVSLGSALNDLFGKSDAQRAKEAEEQKIRDESALKLSELNNQWTKSLLDLSIQQAKLPFEDLQRNLRLIDIRANDRLIKGEDPATVEADRLNARNAAQSSVLTSQSGKISDGSLFGDFKATPENLTRFLSERAAQAGAIALAQGIINNTSGIVGMGGDSAINYLQALINQLNSIQGDLPGPIYSEILARLSAVRDGLSAEKGRYSDFENKYRITGFDQGVYGSANSLIGEVSKDTSYAENLLSTLEQNQQTQLDIKTNTKATADNTAKLTQIDDRKFSYLDLGQKRVISKGFNVSVDRLKLPDAVSSTVLAASSTSAPSDTLSAFRRMIDLAEEANDYLAMIAANTDSKLSTNTSDFESLLIAKIADIRTRRIGKAA